MPELHLAQVLLIVCPLIFLAGFIDSIAGGGGIISLPAYLIAGLPVHYAYGTNKLVACVGTATAAINFLRSGNIALRPALCSAAGALIGAWCTTSIALQLNPDTLKAFLLAALPVVAVILLTRHHFGEDDAAPKPMGSVRLAVISFFIGLVIGGYDGIVGPGTGTFLILAYTGILGYNLKISSGCAKVVNLASNLASTVGFLLGGKILFLVALPAMACNIAGNFAGSFLAIRFGSRFIRPVMIIAILLLFGKLFYDFFA